MFAARLAARQPSRIIAQLPTRRFASQAAKTDGNTFLKERAAVKEHAVGSTELWRKLSIYVTIPVIIVTAINAYNLYNEHWEHWSHLPPLEERTEYSYQNIRSKNFPWGDGDKTAFWTEGINYHKQE